MQGVSPKNYRIKNQESEDQREKIDLETWLDHYQKNPGIFWAILRQRVRLMRYTLEYDGEIEDLMQSSVEKVLKQFQKEKVIPFQYRHTIFSLCAQNAVNQHIRQLNLFRGLPAMGMPVSKEGEKINPAFAGDGERVQVTSTDYLSIDLKIDISLALTKEENKIVKLLLMKYTREEIAKIIKVDERTVYRKIAKIRQKLEAAGLRECAC